MSAIKVVCATFRRVFAWCLSLSILIGCAGQPSLTHQPSAIEPQLFRQGIEALAQNDALKGLNYFNLFLEQNPAGPWFQAANLNAGLALEELKRWKEASDRFRDVIAGTASAPRLQAAALYQLSITHEALGDDPQVVADLIDVLTKKRFQPLEVAAGEAPARLAAAYARVGNFAKAQEYYLQAEAGITRIRQTSTLTPEWLPRTLYMMGDMSRVQVSWSDLETFMRPFARSQIYLLQAAELGQSPWSDKAATELANIYEQLISTIESAPPSLGDPILARRALQVLQWQRAAVVIDCLTDLKARSLPEKNTERPAAELMTALTSVERRLGDLLEQRPAGEGLTPEALARRKTATRVLEIETDDSLEQRFLKSSREDVTSIHTAPAVPATNGDPNL